MADLVSWELHIRGDALCGLGTWQGEELVIPEGVGRISGAFANSRGVEHVKSILFPSTLRDMDADVFRNCINLERVTFRDGLVYPRARLFAGLKKLTEVTLPATVKRLLYDSFENCKSLRRVVIPEGVESIGSNAFANCESLREIAFPASLKEIAADAFRGCPHLITEEGGVSYVGNWAIKGDKSATELTVRSGTVGIAALAFCRCGALKRITLPEGLRFVCGGAFEKCAALERVDFPDTLEHIQDMAFCDCDELQNIALPAASSPDCLGKLFRVHSGGNENDRYVPSTLKTVRILGGKHIAERALIHCYSVERVLLPEGLLSIGEAAFMDCKSIFEIALPESLAEIESRAFFGCKRLSHVAMPKIAPKIDSSAFYGTPYGAE